MGFGDEGRREVGRRMRGLEDVGLGDVGRGTRGRAGTRGRDKQQHLIFALNL